MNLISNLMRLGTVLDEETKELFGKFCEVALMSDDVSRFVKDTLRKALTEDKPPPVEGPRVYETVAEPAPPRRPTTVRRNR
jgi:hypothetical protein